MIPIHDDNPTALVPVWTYTLMIMCVMAFLWQAAIGPRGEALIAYRYGMVPALLFGRATLPPGIASLPPLFTMFTSMFLHGGFMHLAGNLLYLWVFGNNIEDALGHLRFVLFYLLCGLAAALAQALQQPEATTPMIGASGAISGVLGAYLMLYPRARVTVVWLPFFLGALPAIVVLLIWMAIQLASWLITDPSQPGVAWLAHVGGFAAGMVLGPWLRKS